MLRRLGGWVLVGYEGGMEGVIGVSCSIQWAWILLFLIIIYDE